MDDYHPRTSTYFISLPRLRPRSLRSSYLTFLQQQQKQELLPTYLKVCRRDARLLLSAVVRLHKRARIVDFGWILTYVALLLTRYVIVVTLASSSFSLHFHSIFVIFFFGFFGFFPFFFFSSIARWQQRSSFISEENYCMSLVSHVIVHAMPSLSLVSSLWTLYVSLWCFF